MVDPVTKPAKFDVRYDRRVDDDFLALFCRGGDLSSLGDIAKYAGLPLDLQLRRDPKSGKQWATLYAGLTGVLYVYRTADGLRFDAHKTWSSKGEKKSKYGFRNEWREGLPLHAVADERPGIELYLENVIPEAVKRHGLTEGAVQSVVSKQRGDKWAMLDREVLPSYRDQNYKTAVLKDLMDPLLAIRCEVDRRAQRIPAPPKSFGTECDLLAVDRQGRLLAIEVKPAKGGAVAWVPAQAAMYARVLQHWVDAEPQYAREVVAGMLAQRQALGHSEGFKVSLPSHPTVVPVVVLQRGVSESALNQMRIVRDVIKEQVASVPAFEIYEVSIIGNFSPLQ